MQYQAPSKYPAIQSLQQDIHIKSYAMMEFMGTNVDFAYYALTSAGNQASTN
jgi:hypothetical protein